MRLGMTTNVFSEALASGEANLGGLVDFADQEGLAAIELRDDDATIEMQEISDLVKDARAKGVEVTYATKNDMMLETDRAHMERALDRAALCGEGAIMRFLASQTALAPNGKKGYTRDEVETVARTAREYALLAAAKDVFLAMEHAHEPLYGDGAEYFGLHDIFAKLESGGGVPDNLGITFDPANAVFATLCKAPTTPERVMQFVDEHNQYIALVHLKTTVNGKPTATITDADIDNEELFEKLSKVYGGIVCLEIPPAGDLGECRRNMEASVEYLRKSGLLGYFAQKGPA